MTNVRLDYKIIMDLIEPKSRILDLGCGDGTLLSLLVQQKSCTGSGIEIDEKAIYQCIEKGLSVSHGDIDTGLADYSDNRFDYVILYESLQQVLNPQKVILESCRVGKKVIVGIPNFCHFRGRIQVFFNGKVPVTEELPFQWYDTPNLRFLSLRDFRSFCKKSGIQILREIGMTQHKRIHFAPNLFAHIGLYVLTK